MSTAEAAVVRTAPSRRKRKRTDENLDEAERVRRQLQRQKQEFALKLRAEGKTYKPQKSRKSTKAEAGSQPFQPAASSQQHKQQLQQPAVPQREETGTRPEGDVQVVIVPIFWNKKADEKATVVSAAEEVQEHLQELGISVGLDTTNADTPGQKYKYWEQKGVKVRVELGPRDAQKSQACLAISTTPGEVAKKSSYQIGEQLSTAVQKALALVGVVSPSPAADSADRPQTDSKKQKTKKKKQKEQTVVDTQHLVESSGAAESTEPSTAAEPVTAVQNAEATFDKGSPAVTQAGAQPQKPKLPSGDDLGDAFAIEIVAAEDEGVKKKKKKAVVSSATETDDADQSDKPSKSKKSKHKVVQF